jgi:hypothetical protein
MSLKLLNTGQVEIESILLKFIDTPFILTIKLKNSTEII